LGHQRPQVAVIGQRRDIERFARYTTDLQPDRLCLDTWIPMDTYSSFPSGSLRQKLVNFFGHSFRNGRQPVLCLEATDLVNRGNREIAAGAVMSVWVEWARELGIPILACFHHPGLENSRSLSLLQPFPWVIAKGKVVSNSYFVPLCPARSGDPRYCRRKVLENLEELVNSNPANGEILSRASRLLHYYLGVRRVQTVIACLEGEEVGDIECTEHGMTVDLYPLRIPGYPNATIVVAWNKGAQQSPDDQHVITETVSILSNRFGTCQQQARFQRLQHITDQLLCSTSCLVLGMAKNGSMSAVSGDPALMENSIDVIQHFPEALVNRLRDTFSLGNSIEGHELTVALSHFPERMTFWVEGYPTSDDPMSEYIGMVVMRNITEDRKMHSDFLQLQKQDTLRVMSGGITHDLNNVLSAVMGYASYLAMRLSPDDPLREDLSMIEKSTGRAADLVRQLLGYARRSIEPTGLVDANTLSAEVKRLLDPSLNGSYSLDLQLSDDTWHILGDSNQIQQAILNLCLNAKSAMAHGGPITLAVKNIVIAGDEPGCRSIKPGLYTQISVSDQGIGIPRHLRKKVFEPFFTTKPAGKGTGLGLTMVQMITKSHGGRLVLRSRKNQGTVVSLLFPAVPRSVEEAKSAQWVLQRGKEGILLVDDEPSIVDMGARILSDHGYRVYSAASLSEAEETLIKHIDDINLALLDVKSPDEDGLVSSQSLQELSPDLKVVMFSGYPQENSSHSKASQDRFPLVQKPFRARDLLMVVRKTLDGEVMSKGAVSSEVPTRD